MALDLQDMPELPPAPELDPPAQPVVPDLPGMPVLSDNPEMPDLTVGEDMAPPPLPPWKNMKIPAVPDYSEIL